MNNWIRCLIFGHSYVFKGKFNVYEHSKAARPLYEKHCYVCSSCLKSKKVKL